jgi:hypothetical protein
MGILLDQSFYLSPEVCFSCGPWSLNWRQLTIGKNLTNLSYRLSIPLAYVGLYCRKIH